MKNFDRAFMEQKMKILLIGKNGQVGWELQRSLCFLGELIAIDYFDNELCGDLTNLSGIAETIRRVQPDVVVNAAAHTAVDKAESDVGLAQSLNADAVDIIAKETANINALLVHYSTDYVFDGSGSHFRREDEKTGPLNVYGETKLSGELAIINNNPRHLIFRTSWVYATRGANFIKTMLRLAGEKEELSIINDQFGAPTGAELIADCTSLAIHKVMSENSNYGIYHLVASGETTWYHFANLIFETAEYNGESLNVKKVNGVSTSSYVTPAKRPLNSRLCNRKFEQVFNVSLPDWKTGVVRVVKETLGK